MKKLKYLIVLLFVFCLTGCGESAEKILDDTLANMKEIKTLKMTLTAEVGSSLYSLKIVEEGTYAENSSYTKTTTSIAGNSSTEESYTVKKDNKLYAYNGYSDEWTYTITELTTNSNNLATVNGIATNYKTVKKVKSDKKGYTKLEITLDKSKVPEVLGENDSAEGLDLSKDLVLNMYIKDGYIAIIDINLENMLTEDYAEDITKYAMTFELSDYNNVKEIEIPSDILENAKEFKEEEE